MEADEVRHKKYSLVMTTTLLIYIKVHPVESAPACLRAREGERGPCCKGSPPVSLLNSVQSCLYLLQLECFICASIIIYGLSLQ